MKKPLLIIIFLFFASINLTSAAEVNKTSSDYFNQYMDKALQFVKTQQYDQAFLMVSYLDKQLSDDVMPYNVEDKVFISLVFSEISRLSENPVSYHEEIIRQLTKVRLFTDSLNQPEAPMWRSLDSSMFATIELLKQSVIDQNNMDFQTHINTILQTYDCIYPSMALTMNENRLVKLDEKINNLDVNRNQLYLSNEINDAIEVIAADLQYAFYGLDEDQADPSLWWVIFTTGSIIILTLSYVGWRKYKGENAPTKEPSRYKTK